MYCNTCDRSFSDIGYEQHMETSAAHQTLYFTCPLCPREFACEESLQQHIETSAAHQTSYFTCPLCPREFSCGESLQQHLSNAPSHWYCQPCHRLFLNDHDLIQHQHSKLHLPATLFCPFCQNQYTIASALITHLEMGYCPSGVEKHRLDAAILRIDPHHRITRPQLAIRNDHYQYLIEPIEATERAWNGYGFGCYLCPKEFGNLYSLNRHLRSPVHEQEIYNCPKSRCGRTYKLLSGLVMHVESESCGLMGWEQVQEQARGGLGRVMGRLVEGPAAVTYQQELY